MTRRSTAAVLSALVMSTAMGCGNLTPGGLTGDATVIVSGDADTLAAAVQLAPAPAVVSGPAAAAGPAATAEEAEGELQVAFMAHLVSQGGGQVQLGTDAMEVSVDLRGRDEADAVDRQVIPALHYTELRLVFTKVHAEVEGLVIDGQVVPEVHVELENLSLLVSRSIELDVQDGQSAELVVDLNSLAWLDAVDPLTGAVDQSVFQDLVNVVVR
jgi:hypothetical protein